MKRMREMLMKRLAWFTSRHPFVGPILWILAVQYFVAQLVVAAAWIRPVYDWRYNVISDLGAASCGQYGDRFVCSPLSWLMNLSFIVFGVTILVGAMLIYQSFERTKVSKVGFGLMILSGVGTIGVGLFPEDIQPVMHLVSAVMALLLGNVALIFLAASLKGIRGAFRMYTYGTGFLCVAAFLLFASRIYLGLGEGGMERVVSYPFAVWMMIFGIYMTFVRIRASGR